MKATYPTLHWSLQIAQSHHPWEDEKPQKHKDGYNRVCQMSKHKSDEEKEYDSYSALDTEAPISFEHMSQSAFPVGTY